MTDSTKLLTAIDYINNQETLERQAKELMPYDPNTCTYVYGALRQTLFACLTCYNNDPAKMNGICYSCSIQCHSDHQLVELFTKRNFTCDCGTTRMPDNGCCKLRYAPLNGKKKEPAASSNSSHGTSNLGVVDLSTINSTRRNSLEQVWKEIPADDIPSSSNVYGQNFKGLFCSCHRQYNPLEESGNMIQCNFGESCNEEWYHEECILGLKPGLVDRKRVKSDLTIKRKYPDGVNILDILPEATDEAVTTTEITKEIVSGKEKVLAEDDKSTENVDQESDDDNDPLPLEGFPDYESFEGFICWSCVEKYRPIFDKLIQYKEVCLDPIYHVDGVQSLEERTQKLDQTVEVTDKPPSKKIKLENGNGVKLSEKNLKYSIFLKDDYQTILKELFIDLESKDVVKTAPSIQNDKTVIKLFLQNHTCLYDDDPVYEPPEDEDLRSESGSSIFDLGSKVLESLPRSQAIEGVQAYEMIKTRLKQFFKPFAENGEVVTEDKIKDFFDGLNDEVKK